MQMYLGPRKHGIDPRQMVVLRPRRKRTRYRFNWPVMVLLPMVIFAAAWFLRSVEPVPWTRVMDALGVHDRERYSQLAALGIALCGVAMIWRILKGGNKENRDS